MRNTEQDVSARQQRISPAISLAGARRAGRSGLALLAVLLLTAGGCATQPKAGATLDTGYAALARGDLAAASASADEVLATSATGPGAAEAYYLRGRVSEERAVASSSAPQAAAFFRQAAIDYRNALAVPAAPAIEGLAHAGLALAAFSQEDYATALQEWGQAYPKLTKPEDQSRALYRMGQCYQRVGRWGDADQCFATVQQQFPGTQLAAEAARHQGARAFTVRLATFNDLRTADAAAVEVRKYAPTAARVTDPTNRALHYLQITPIASYSEAKTLKARFAAMYPNALILP